MSLAASASQSSPTSGRCAIDRIGPLLDAALIEPRRHKRDERESHLTDQGMSPAHEPPLMGHHRRRERHESEEPPLRRSSHPESSSRPQSVCSQGRVHARHLPNSTPSALLSDRQIRSARVRALPRPSCSQRARKGQPLGGRSPHRGRRPSFGEEQRERSLT